MISNNLVKSGNLLYYFRFLKIISSVPKDNSFLPNEKNRISYFLSLSNFKDTINRDRYAENLLFPQIM